VHSSGIQNDSLEVGTAHTNAIDSMFSEVGSAEKIKNKKVA